MKCFKETGMEQNANGISIKSTNPSFYGDNSILVSCNVIKIANIERMELCEEQL